MVKTQQQIHQRTFLRTIKHMYYHRGLIHFWTGFRHTLFHSIPSTTIYLTSYTYIDRWIVQSYQGMAHNPRIGEKMEANSIYIISLTGGMARFISVLSTSPLELLRTQYQANAINNRSKNFLFSSLCRHSHASFYQALTLNMIRDVPFSAIYWVVLNKSKLWLVDGGRMKDHSFIDNLCAGLVSGSITAFLTCPLDVLKTKCSVIETNNYNLRCLVTVFVSIIKDKGVEGLFRGALARIVRVGLGCGIMISIFEKFQGP
jgi:hypothetical protein